MQEQLDRHAVEYVYTVHACAKKAEKGDKCLQMAHGFNLELPRV